MLFRSLAWFGLSLSMVGCGADAGGGEPTGESASALGTSLFARYMTGTYNGVNTTVSNVDWVDCNASGACVVGGWIQGNHAGANRLWFSSTVFVAVAPQDRAFIAKYDASGNALWAKAVATGSETLDDGAINAAGEIYTVSSRNVSTSSIAVVNDVGILRKYDAAGVLQWTRTLGSTGSHGMAGVDVDSAGLPVVGAYHSGNVDFGAGVVALPSAFSVEKYDASNNLLFSRTYAVTGSLDSLDVAVGAGNSVYFAARLSGTTNLGSGSLTGSGNLVVAGLTAAGANVWSRQLGVAGVVGIRHLDKDVVLAGSHAGPVTFDSFVLSGAGDTYVARLRGTTGITAWARDVAGTGGESPTGISTGRKCWSDIPNAKVAVGGPISISTCIPVVGLTIDFDHTLNYGLGTLTAGGPFADSSAALLDGNTGAALWNRQYTSTSSMGTTGISLDGAANSYVLGDFDGTSNLGFGAVTATPTNWHFLTKLDP